MVVRGSRSIVISLRRLPSFRQLIHYLLLDRPDLSGTQAVTDGDRSVLYRDAGFLGQVLGADRGDGSRLCLLDKGGGGSALEDVHAAAGGPAEDWFDLAVGGGADRLGVLDLAVGVDLEAWSPGYVG